MEIPLLLPALLVVAVAVTEWRATRLVAVGGLAAGFVLLLAAFTYPGWSAGQIVEAGDPLLAYALAAARPVGLACVVFALLRLVRSAATPW